MGWPRESVLGWRARRRLASADPAGADRVAAELRDAGFAPLSAELAAERAQAARGTGAAEPLVQERARLTGDDISGAGAVARQALASATGAARLEPLLVLGMSELAAQRHAAAFACFHEAQAVAPMDVRAYNYEARMRLAARDVTGARHVLEQGLAHVPGDPTLTQALRALSGDGTTPR